MRFRIPGFVHSTSVGRKSLVSRVLLKGYFFIGPNIVSGVCRLLRRSRTRWVSLDPDFPADVLPVREAIMESCSSVTPTGRGR